MTKSSVQAVNSYKAFRKGCRICVTLHRRQENENSSKVARDGTDKSISIPKLRYHANEHVDSMCHNPSFTKLGAQHWNSTKLFDCLLHVILTFEQDRKHRT